MPASFFQALREGLIYLNGFKSRLIVGMQNYAKSLPRFGGVSIFRIALPLMHLVLPAANIYLSGLAWFSFVCLFVCLFFCLFGCLFECLSVFCRTVGPQRTCQSSMLWLNMKWGPPKGWT